MSSELISKKTRSELQELLVSEYVLRGITTLFDNADVICDADHTPRVSGQRRYLIEQYYHSLDFARPGDARKFLRVCEEVLERLDSQIENAWSDDNRKALETKKNTLVRCLTRDGYGLAGGRLVSVSPLPAADELKAASASFDAPYLRTQIERMQDAVDSDPRLAIGTAKEFLETTCKTILAELGEEVSAKAELPELVKQTRAALKLLPEDVPDDAKGSEVIRRLLSNLGSVASGLAELRNLYGTGHGPHGKPRGLLPRHARLAVGAAAVLATFLFETHEARKKK